MTGKKVLVEAGISKGDTVGSQHQVSSLKERGIWRDKGKLNRPVAEH
jgi:hypothetical protein